MTNLTLLGRSGRMNHVVRELVVELSDFEIVATAARTEDMQSAIAACDVVLDFSGPDLSMHAMRLASAASKPCVIGTTGFTAHQESEIQQLAGNTSIFKSANFSLGTAAAAHISVILTRLLGTGYDVEIVEMHHRNKRDAPSGTAVLLAGKIAAAKNQELLRVAVHGRKGHNAIRTTNEIGIHAVRGGDVAGEHTVLFAGVGETLEIKHRATSRICFAAGALKASKWIRDKEPGLYGMSEMLNLH